MAGKHRYPRVYKPNPTGLSLSTKGAEVREPGGIIIWINLDGTESKSGMFYEEDLNDSPNWIEVFDYPETDIKRMLNAWKA
jgi:hypothetical protein